METLGSKTMLNKTFIIRSDFRSKIKTGNDLKRILTQGPCWFLELWNRVLELWFLAPDFWHHDFFDFWDQLWNRILVPCGFLVVRYRFLGPFLLFIRFLNLLSILWTGLVIKCELLLPKPILWSIVKPCITNGGITVVHRGPVSALNPYFFNIKRIQQK